MRKSYILNLKMLKNFFKDFKKYWSIKEICKRIDAFAKRLDNYSKQQEEDDKPLCD